MVDRKVKRLFSFIDETIGYFLSKLKGVNRDCYIADRDIRNILDKTLNDIILCLIDIAEECLKKNKRDLPDTYRDTLLACYEFVGDISLKIAPLVKHRNEAIHQYLNLNWHNIVIVRNKIGDIKEFLDKMRKALV